MPNGGIAANGRSPAHILFLTYQMGGGGAEMQLLRLANHLDRRKFRVSVAVMRRGGNYEPLLASDVRLVEIGGGPLPKAFAALRRELRSNPVDILCPFLDIPASLGLVASFTVSPRPAVVACVQAPPSIVFEGPIYTRRRGFLELYRRLLPRMDRIVAISRGVAEDIAALSPRAVDRMEVIYNAGVDSTLRRMIAENPPMPHRADRPLIVAGGRLNRQKGFAYLLDAFAKVRAEMEATLWILGEGEQRQMLESHILGLGLSRSVCLLGFQKNPFSYFAAADLFVLSSIFEGFGNVVVEAMACGSPVISTDCPHGPAEIIRDGESGLLVPPADPQALADAMLRVLRDPELAARLSRNGSIRAQDFDVQRIAAQYEDLFTDVLSRRSAQGQPTAPASAASISG